MQPKGGARTHDERPRARGLDRGLVSEVGICRKQAAIVLRPRPPVCETVNAREIAEQSLSLTRVAIASECGSE